MGAVLVTMAWTTFWWRLNSRMEWNWNGQTGMAQIRSGQRGRGRKEHNWRKRWQNLRIQQHILIQSPKSCALPTPPLSAHLGRNLCCLHPLGSQDTQPPLSPATAWIQKGRDVYSRSTKPAYTTHRFSAYLEKAVSPPSLWKCWGDVGHSEVMACHYEGLQGTSPLAPLCLFMLVRSLKS